MTHTTPPVPLVSLQRACVRFGAVTALRDVDLTLNRGDQQGHMFAVWYP